MHFVELVDVSRAVAETTSRLEKTKLLAALLIRLRPDEIEIGVAFLSGAPRQGRIGLGSAIVSAAASTAPAITPTLELHDVDRAFERIAASSGPGSSSARAAALGELLARATSAEQGFTLRLIMGELRQGALEGVLVDAVAKAGRSPAERVRRAAMLAGGLEPVARDLLTAGPAALDAYELRPFHPVQPMLAESAGGVGEALDALGDASLEYKIDGARIQVHRAGDEVRVYSRNLRDVTAAVPDIVSIVRAFPAREFVLDGETVALRDDGTPHPFQVTMRRFGRKLDVDRARESLPLAPFFFDALQLEGVSLIDAPQRERARALGGFAPAEWLVPRLDGATKAEAAAFAERAFAAGHEGVMAKAADATYAAGRRGRTWLKVKRAQTLDLVVLAAEWGHGRRHGTLSNLHLGARDPARGGFVMLGKTFKGLTDQMLAWQTSRLLELEMARDAYTVYVRPELVVEIAFNDLQESPQYPGGLALRFARVKRYRVDKTAAEADTISTVRSLHARAVRATR
jgi:DNA ligase-1